MSGIILIVEDHEFVQKTLVEWLNMEFPYYEVIAVSSGEEAVAIAHTRELSLILMDITLPGMSGIEATRRIKAKGVTTPIVMLTVHEDEVYRTDAANAGASAYVTKRQMQTELIPTLQVLLPTTSEGETNNNR